MCIEPQGPLIVRTGTSTELSVDVALVGNGIVQLFDDWLRPHFENGALEPC